MAQTAVLLTTKVLPGNRIEVAAPELPEGADVDVIVMLSDTSEQAALAERFRALADRWYTDTEALSSVSQMAMHPAYQEVIGMGRAAVPFLLKELQQQPQHWFWALRAITGDDPIRPEQRGKMGEMAAAWLQWGREHGYIA
jgi:hypothetical protein